MKSLYKDVRTLDLQVMLASGVKEENCPLPIPASDGRCFYYPYESVITSISVWSDLRETTLDLFFSGIFCKISSGHAGVASG